MEHDTTSDTSNPSIWSISHGKANINGGEMDNVLRVVLIHIRLSIALENIIAGGRQIHNSFTSGENGEIERYRPDLLKLDLTEAEKVAAQANLRVQVLEARLAQALGSQT